MFAIDQYILLAAVLILFGILSSKLSAKLGLPVLVLFLIIGMLAGEDGIGGIAFHDAPAAHALGTLALAMILFDGGLQTPTSSIRLAWKPASMLATFGVIITSLITGYCAAIILQLPLIEGLLLGAIVGSTDAAAVFSLLRNAGIHLNKRLKATLEIESASNDPIAIFLTVGLLEIILNDLKPGLGFFQMFFMQMGIGALIGMVVGRFSLALINRIKLSASGLYPVLAVSMGLLSFGLAANLGGSGFLAIFISGVVIGNSHFTFQRGTFLFQDGLAWLSQITMFLVLGLLVTPSHLFEVWLEGLIIAAVLIFVARPLAVLLTVKWFGFNVRELSLISWVGLRGSVPIILAIFPLLFNLPGASLIFDVVFFVVLISAIIQGSTLGYVAKKLGVVEKPPSTAAATLEITALADVNAEIVEYTLGETPRAAGRSLSQMALPEGVVIAMITRGSQVIMPRGSTTLRPDDHIFAVLQPETRYFVDAVFSELKLTNEDDPEPGDEIAQRLIQTELKFKGQTTVGDVANSYGIHLDDDKEITLQQLLLQTLQQQGGQGSITSDTLQDRSVQINHFTLRVCDTVGTRITTVGMSQIG